jgi:hypothetical protein
MPTYVTYVTVLNLILSRILNLDLDAPRDSTTSYILSYVGENAGIF